MLTCGWLWLYFGAFLMLMELLSPGFVIFFFGLSASTVGLLRLAFGEAMPPMVQMIAFSFFSIVYLAFLRRLLKPIFSGDKEETRLNLSGDLIGRRGNVTERISPPLSGRAMIGDAEWTAVADEPIEPGSIVEVVSQDNLTVKVSKLSKQA